MVISEQHLQESLDTRGVGPVGFAHGQLKYSAEIAANLYGCEWAHKHPNSLESIKLKQRLRDMVFSNTPAGHSNKDVVWQRFRQYAIQYCSKAVH